MIEQSSPQAFFAPPVFRVTLAERRRLLDLLDAQANCRLTVVKAPAGYGKTWLLGRRFATLRAAGAAVVWLGIERADAGEFLCLLVEGLARAGLEVGTVEAVAAQGFADVPLAAAVRALCAVLEASGTDTTIIVDDLHRAEREVAEEVIARLLVEAPPSARFVLSGREIAGLPQAALRARGDLCEIDIGELRFSRAEARELLPRLDTHELQRLLERTEGWPVALQLARMWLDAKPERSSLLDAFSGRTSEVAEYLTEQVLADLSAPLQRILSDISILDALNADLVTAVTGSRDTWRRVLEDRRLEHFLVPLDEERYWFRLHHLLLEYLRARRRDMGRSSGTLHGRAALWFQANGDVCEAVRHCVLAEDMARAARLIERTGGWELVLFSGTSLMRRLLGSLPTDRLREFPRVQISRAYLAAKDGDIAYGVRLYEEIAATPRRGADEALERDLLVAGHLIFRYADRPVDAGDLARLHSQYHALPAADAVARAALMNSACLLALSIGHMPQALEACVDAVREMRKIGSVIGLAYCLCHLGLVQLHLGERRESEATLREALALAEENFGADSGLKAIANVYLALALHARGDVAEGEDRLGASLEQVESADGWLDLYAEAYEIAVANAVAVGNYARAADLLERMRQTALRRGLIRLERLCAALRAQSDALRRLGQTSPHRACVQRGADRSEAVPEWTAGAWRDNPSIWREHHAAGVAKVFALLARERAAEALRTLDDLLAAAAAGERRRHLRALRVLRAAVLSRLGEIDTATATFTESLQSAIAEDDTQFLVDWGPVLWPLLQAALVWSRDLAAGSRVRHVLAAAIAAIRRARAVDARAELSARELEVLMELAQGAPNKVIARNLQMTENTVKFHLKSIFHKLEVRHRAEALYAARARGLLS